MHCQQESEIVEVLWKQDVDLGYTLASPAKIASPQESAANSSGLNKDDCEKLKALQELKSEKVSELMIENLSQYNPCDYVFFLLGIEQPTGGENARHDMQDEWAGINFTVDNETGE